MSADREIEYVIRDRRRGKTTRLIEWLMEDQTPTRHGFPRRVILTGTRREAEWMIREYGLQPHQVYPVALLPKQIAAYSDVQFALDNGDHDLLHPLRQWGLDIRMITMTGSIRETEADILEWALNHSRSEVEDRIAALRAAVQSTLEEQPMLPQMRPNHILDDRHREMVMLPSGVMMSHDEMMIRGHMAMHMSKSEPSPETPKKPPVKRAAKKTTKKEQAR